MRVGRITATVFQPVDQNPDFTAIEAAILARWDEEQTFHRSLEARADGPLFTFNEGPPTANGRPGVHHVEARAFKDLFPRYKTMKGYRVPRRAGWDCHGIPVELAVERELGFTHKQDIEDYGIEAFNRLCRQSVEAHVEEWTTLTRRIGFWVDTDNAYWTMSTSYIESVWWSLSKLFDADLLYEGHKVLPYCGRCGTSLSDHEVAQGYAETVDPSAYVRFPITEGPLAKAGASLLVWTTTPWTLIANTLVAVGEDIRYVLAQAPGDAFPVVVAADLASDVLGPDATIHRDVTVQEMLGVHYSPPFDLVVPAGGDHHYVTTADFVDTAEGTGLVHLAPAFGAEDHEVGLAEGVQVVNPVDAEARFTAAAGPYSGMFVKDADAPIIKALEQSGRLLRAEEHTHTYPFCWRCKSPLIYYATPSWYIATTQYAQRMLEVNAQTDWHPDHIRDGRYGDWLAHNVDWALSRTRYWGTPLPIWRCQSGGHLRVVASRAELTELAGEDLLDFDLHRPHVDSITFDCPDCGQLMRRDPAVIDAWYDSGAMPFAQFGYPHTSGSWAHLTEEFPADFICEAIDQTRGWFYSQMAIATALFDSGAYRHVLCLGHIVDDDGHKMSKSAGNILDPWQLIEAYGADPLRWLLLTQGSPWGNRRVSEDAVSDVVRRLFLTLWNSYFFFVTYARIDRWSPDGPPQPSLDSRPVMDRWILAELAAVVTQVDRCLERFDATGAGEAIDEFVDSLSNWYIRRTRNRFWAPISDDDGAVADKDAAFWTLHECLVTISALLAPFTPFLAEALYTNLVLGVDPKAPQSVHLLDFPHPDRQAANEDLRSAMATARAVVSIGLRARNDAAIGVRQPLRTALVSMPRSAGWAQVAEVVAAELNIKTVRLSDTDHGVTHRLKADFRELGRSFGAMTPQVAGAIAQADPVGLVDVLRAGQSIELTLADGQRVTVASAMVQIIEESREGWQVATEGEISVALEVTLDDALRREGLARDLVRTVNDLRKQQGFHFSDRVVLEAAVDGPLEQALRDHRAVICAETLATDIVHGRATGGWFVEVGGHAARLKLEKQ